MLIRIASLSFLGVLLGTIAPLAAAPPRAKFEPEYGCYIGAFVLKDEHVGGDMLLFERLIGKAHASYFTYVGYGQPFPAEWVEAVKEVGAVPHIAFEPNGGLLAVQDDNYLREWAYAARRARCPIFLRYASEMNGDWQNYGGDPALYIRKWRLVHDVMEEVAPNVAMVWNPFCFPTSPIPRYYPGDEYVDWVGINIYSVHHHNNDLRQPSDHEDPRDLLRYVYDLYSDRKPIMICEYAATHYCLACGRATVGFALEKMKLLYYSLRSEFPRVKMINWFNWDTISGGAAENNYALTDDERILKLYRELISSPYFLGQVPYEREPPSTPGATRVVEVPTDLALPKRELPAIGSQPPPSPTGAGEDQGTGGEPALPHAPAVGEPALADARITPPLHRTAHATVPPPPPTPRPDVELQSPAAGAEVSGPVTVRGRVATGLQAEYVLFRVDGEVAQITNRAPYQYLWNTARFQAGEHTLQVVAIRPDNSEVESESVKVTVHH